VIFVQITGADGKVLGRVEGPEDKLDEMRDQVEVSAIRHQCRRASMGLPDDVALPLTITWGPVQGYPEGARERDQQGG
jgi:hypothetical protein